MTQNRQRPAWQYHYCPHCKEETLHEAQEGRTSELIPVDADLDHWAIRRYRICRHCWEPHVTDEISKDRQNDQQSWNSAVLSEQMDVMAEAQSLKDTIKQLRQHNEMIHPALSNGTALLDALERDHEALCTAMDDATALTDPSPVTLSAIEYEALAVP